MLFDEDVFSPDDFDEIDEGLISDMIPDLNLRTESGVCDLEEEEGMRIEMGIEENVDGNRIQFGY